MTRVFLGLGSNLGDRAAYLDFGRRALQAEGVGIRRASTVEETEPVGPVLQGAFLNQVLEVETELAPEALLAVAKAIEARAGRDATGPRWGPRTLDIDILLHGDLVSDSSSLRIPHPELANRDFVVRGLVELDPGLLDPRSGVALVSLLPPV